MNIRCFNCFRLILEAPMTRRSLAAWASFLALFLAGMAARPSAAHDVKDPVCRMTVDSDTTPWAHRLGGKTFYFCAQRCRDRFAAEPARYEKLAALLEKGDVHEYAVDFSTATAAVAGQPVELIFGIRYKDREELVKEFELIHERLFHLIMVTEDLRWFEHQHPVRGEDGLFRLTWTFPAPGRYRMYTDFTPADGDNQVIPVELGVGGGAERRVPPRPTAGNVVRAGSVRAEIRIQPGPLTAEKPSILTYRLTDAAGRPLRDLQPFIGAMGHLLAISQDGKEVVHTHALSPTTGAHMVGGLPRVTTQMATKTGPAMSFKLTLPAGGIYKLWAQFMRKNRVITVAYVLKVRDLWETTAAPAGARCPVMGNPIANPAAAPSLLVNDRPIRFCCAGCDDKLKKDPARYLKEPLRDPVSGRSFRATASTLSLVHDGRLYLFAASETRDRFARRIGRPGR
jgi:YHS domain-containing protein